MENGGERLHFGNAAGRFFKLYRDDYVTIDDEQYAVRSENPDIKFTLSRESDGRFTLKANNKYDIAGSGKYSYFLDGRAQKVLIADAKFTRSVYRLYEVVRRKGTLYISETDMPEFYAAVLKSVSDYVGIDGMELISDYVPPDLTVQLYVDCGDNNTICADLMFCYDNNTYNAFAGGSAPHYDKLGESAAKNAVLDYFTVSPGRDKRSLMIANDDAAYTFITNGLTELSQSMETYVSEKFRRMLIRPPVKPKVGVSIAKGVPELDISDDNYSGEELAEILNAYRLGVKYRRLKDGSFAVIDDSLAQLKELTENLDLSAKDLTKKKLKLPLIVCCISTACKTAAISVCAAARNLRKRSRNITRASKMPTACPFPTSWRTPCATIRNTGFAG